MPKFSYHRPFTDAIIKTYARDRDVFGGSVPHLWNIETCIRTILYTLYSIRTILYTEFTTKTIHILYKLQ